MAITPNTNFSTAQIFTAGQANRFPRGVMARAFSSTTFALGATEVVATGMDVTFTAEANRLYKITYVEPEVDFNGTAGSYFYMRIRKNNASGQIIQTTVFQQGAAYSAGVGMTLIATTDFTAGSQQLVGTMIKGGGGGNLSVYRDTVGAFYSHLIVEDIGAL